MASRKPRSPAAPSRSLRKCFEDTKKIYERYSHGTFTRSEVGSALSISATSGPARQRIGSILQFGLIESVASGTGGDHKVSQRFLTLNSSPPGGADFKGEALAAVRHASVYNDLLSSFREKLPPVEAVAQRLETQLSFNAETAKISAAALEDSLRFAGVLDGSNNILPVRASRSGSAERGHEEPEVKEPDVGEHDEVPATGVLRLQIPLGPGRVAAVSYPDDMTPTEAKKLAAVLGAVVA